MRPITTPSVHHCYSCFYSACVAATREGDTAMMLAGSAVKEWMARVLVAAVLIQL